MGHEFIKNKYKTISRLHETYNLQSGNRVTANLLWNFPLKTPGKACEIQVKTPKITQTNFIMDFIQKDADWQPKNDTWTQCIQDEGDEYLFTVKRQPGNISIHVKRDAFSPPTLCSE